jgi:hypothetical protein
MIEGFQHGVIVMGFAIAALFFARFWRSTRDRLFALFAVAFVILAAHQSAFLFVPEKSEARTLLYLVRLVAFLVILAAILDKNRKRG